MGDGMASYEIQQCCIFGIDKKEHDEIAKIGQILPKQFTNQAQRQYMNANIFQNFIMTKFQRDMQGLTLQQFVCIFKIRYVVKLNPWTVMRVLGENYNYGLRVQPHMSTVMQRNVDSRSVAIWSLDRRVPRLDKSLRNGSDVADDLRKCSDKKNGHSQARKDTILKNGP